MNLAEASLPRATDRGQQAHLVLCKLEPVTGADLGEVAE
jgi:hypothetical protein